MSSFSLYISLGGSPPPISPPKPLKVLLTSYRLTVRTLDFHSNNVGSIPASLNILNKVNYLVSLTKFNTVPKTEYIRPWNVLKSPKSFSSSRTHYTFRFSSIITPGALTSIRLLNRSDAGHTKNKFLIKQSYMILTWVLYLRNSTLSQDEKNNKRLRRPGFFIYPKKQFRFTNTKAPMAHKTFSQEQYMFKFYHLSISFKVNSDTRLHSVNKSLYFMLSQRRFYSFYGTNLFFLKRFTLVVNAVDYEVLRLF